MFSITISRNPIGQIGSSYEKRSRKLLMRILGHYDRMRKSAKYRFKHGLNLNSEGKGCSSFEKSICCPNW